MQKIIFLFAVVSLFYQCQNDKKETVQVIEKEQVIIEKLPHQDSLAQIFPAEIIQRIRTYRNDLDKIETVEEAAAFYQSATALRDTLIPILRRYTEEVPTETIPDLFWLADVFPTFVPQMVAEGTEYYLFHDYRQWEEIARQTSDPTDDAFVELQYQLHPDDSIEYSYPAYFLQTWDYGESSLLGRGIHVSLLNTMERTWADTTVQLFRAEMEEEKEWLLNDILAEKEGSYWETQENILNELGEIISTDFAILTKNEKIAIRQRQQQFREPDKNNILVDGQSGGE